MEACSGVGESLLLLPIPHPLLSWHPEAEEEDAEEVAARGHGAMAAWRRGLGGDSAEQLRARCPLGIHPRVRGGLGDNGASARYDDDLHAFLPLPPKDLVSFQILLPWEDFVAAGMGGFVPWQGLAEVLKELPELGEGIRGAELSQFLRCWPCAVVRSSHGFCCNSFFPFCFTPSHVKFSF